RARSTAPPAPHYTEMGANRYTDRSAAQVAALQALTARTAAEELAPASEQERAAALEARRARRAYDGAPPTVPHPVHPRGYPACLSCHETGMSLEGRVAPALSHPPMSNCLQCHAVEDPSAPGSTNAAGVPVDNSFEGAFGRSRMEGWSTAPPVIPHR